MDDCVFCKMIEEEDVEYDFGSFLVLKDKYPVTLNHVLIVPRQHMKTIFSFSKSDYFYLMHVSKKMMVYLQGTDKRITGFNFGCNLGESAGQTVEHIHFHLIPRRDGDLIVPDGGVRGCIPDKRIPE